MNRSIATGALALAIALTLGACGPSEEERRQTAEAQAAQVAEAQANEQLELYRQARSDEQWDIAASYGEFVNQTYPDTAAAREIGESFDEVSANAQGMRESRRLEGLWVYHQVEEDGAMSRTAYIYSEAPERTTPPVRLVLRAHPEWGDSVYLLPEGETPRFTCENPCNVEVRFDDAGAEEFEAVVSEPTENHAMFIDDFDAFLAGMGDAERVVLEVATEGGGTVSLAYEVGGFDAERFEQGNGDEAPAE